MSLCVDTCVLIDIVDDDPDFGRASAQCLARAGREDLVLCPISYIELAPVFDGKHRLLDAFLDGVGVHYDDDFEKEDVRAAFAAWARQVDGQRAKRLRRRPIADILIGAFASRRGGLVTRNGADFRGLFPTLTIIDPVRGR